MPCYYCDNAFVDKDVVVELTLASMQRQDNGGVLAGDRRTAYAHQHCTGEGDG